MSKWLYNGFVIWLILGQIVCYAQETKVIKSVNVQISFSKEKFRIKQKGSHFQIHNIKTNTYSNKDSSVLPYIPYFVVLPHGVEIDNLQILIQKTELFIDDVYIAFPENKAIKEYNNSIKKQVTFSFNADTLSNSFPNINDIVEIESPELQAGYLLIKLLICPFQYYFEYNKLDLLKHIELKINYNINYSKIKTFDNIENEDSLINIKYKNETIPDKKPYYIKKIK